MKKLLFLLGAAALIAIGLSVAQQTIVSGGRLRKWVNGKPEELLVEYDGATAWIPGTLRLSNLRVRSRDHNVEWEFRMASARLDYSPFAILSKTFHVRRLNAQGLVFHLRERQEKGAVSRNVKLFPEIAGYADPPMRDPTPPPPHSSSTPWTVRLDSLVAEPAGEIWIGKWRFEGDARVTGGFSLQPGRHADIGPAAIDFRRVALKMGTDTVLAEAHGVARARIRPFDPPQVKGSQVWPYIDGEFSLHGRIDALDFFRHILDEKDSPRLRRGRGEGGVDVKIERGIGSGSATLDARSVEAATSKANLRGTLVVRTELPRWDLEKGEIDVTGSKLELRDVTASTAGGAEVNWWGKARVVEGKIRDGLDARMDLQCRDARPLYKLFGVGLPKWAEGLLQLENLHATTRIRLTPIRKAFDELAATGGEFRVSGEYDDVRGETHGVFLLEKDKLAVAVQIEGAMKSLRPLGAREWYAVAAAEHRKKWEGRAGDSNGR